MTRIVHRAGQLKKVPLPCGCNLHTSGLMLDVCDTHVKSIDEDRMIALMLAANKRIAEVIERIDAYDLDQQEFSSIG